MQMTVSFSYDFHLDQRLEMKGYISSGLEMIWTSWSNMMKAMAEVVQAPPDKRLNELNVNRFMLRCIVLKLNDNRSTWKISDSQSVESGLTAACRSSSGRGKDNFEGVYLGFNTHAPCGVHQTATRKLCSLAQEWDQGKRASRSIPLVGPLTAGPARLGEPRSLKSTTTQPAVGGQKTF